MLRHTTPLFFLLALTSDAQVTIGQNEMPHAGDELRSTRAAINPFLNYQATGPAYTWDFNLVHAEEDTTVYQSVSSTNFIYALAYADIFFNPNRANHARAGVDLPFNELLPIEDPYTFFYRSSSVYKKVGYGVDLAGIPVPITFTEQDVVYNLPLNYGNSDVSSSAYQVSVPTLAYYGYQQERTNEVDGWGSITTPAGTWDVLRVKTTLEGRDSINIDTLSVGFSVDRPIVREYKWLAPGLRVPVLQVNTSEIFGLELITSIYFYDVPRTLAVNEPFAQVLCPGSSVSVPYTATGVFNTGGFLVPANVFTAQLSDENGDFTNAVNIGSITSAVSGSITATIPGNTPVGSGYRIRVIANHPDFIGAVNSAPITISDEVPIASVAANGPIAFCAGGSVVLSGSSSSSASLQWMLDGADIPGATENELTVTEGGTYTVRASNACGNAVSDAVLVVVNEAPVHTLDQPAYLSCDGQLPIISAVDQSGQSALEYVWFLNVVVITGESASALLAGEVGDYSVQVTNTVTGCSWTTAASPFILDQVQTPSVSAAGPVSFCAGGSVLLSVNADPFLDYQWYAGGDALIDATSPEYTAAQAGSYTVVATSANGCTSNASTAVEVQVVDAPAQPTVTAAGPTTFCAGGEVTLEATVDPDASYTWLLNGTAIPDADAATLEATVSGAYSVVLTSPEGCASEVADAVQVVVNEAPIAPIIEDAGGSLTTDAVGSLQWSLNGEVIDGAVSSTLEPTENGSYAVTVTDTNGCSTTSDPYAYISTGIATEVVDATVIFPNPSSGVFFVRVAVAGAGYVLYDATGASIRAGRTGTTATRFDLSSEAPGVYFLQLQSGTTTTVERVVLTR